MLILYNIIKCHRSYKDARKDINSLSACHFGVHLIVGILRGDRARLQRLGFHLQIDLSVAISGLKGDVSQPGTNRVDVHAGTQQMYCRRCDGSCGG